ncbi:MAG: hypothetical protein BalsKO_07120 [Balneolaceae bacterium]
MDLGRNLLIHSFVMLFVLSCSVSNSDPKPVQDLQKEIIGHWEYENKSIHFTEVGTFQDSTFRSVDLLFNNHTCEVDENDTKVPILVVSGNYAIADTLLEFSSLNTSLNCNPEPVELRMYPYYDKVISISNDSLTLVPTRVYFRESVSDTTLLGTWKTINHGSIYNYELPNGWVSANITEEVVLTYQSYSSMFYSPAFPDDSLKIESNYFYDHPEFVNSCCTFPITFLVDHIGNRMRWTGPLISSGYRYIRTNYR